LWKVFHRVKNQFTLRYCGKEETCVFKELKAISCYWSTEGKESLDETGYVGGVVGRILECSRKSQEGSTQGQPALLFLEKTASVLEGRTGCVSGEQ
jgi:hypothetical protein